MEIIKEIEDLRQRVKNWKSSGLTVGFVPTMGFLHEGHTSLIARAHNENDRVVVSIFVNPTQFGPNEDLEKYPRNIENDTRLCLESGGDVIFLPEVETMYPKDFSSYVDMSGLTETLCGRSRPGHFRGVCSVVCKLFNIVQADRAYFGEKDAQQLAVIRQMVRDLNMEVEIIGCPIIREPDGLAMSSRNTYLSESQRRDALVLSQSLSRARHLLEQGERDSDRIKSLILEQFSNAPTVRLDYAEIMDADSLRPSAYIEGKVLIALAAFVGKTRLIDNMTYEV